MNNQLQPNARSGDDLPYLDGTNDHLMFTRGFWNKMIAVARGVVNTTGWNVTENGILTPQTAAAGNAGIAGQWDPTVKYDANVIVFFTPDGDFGRTFYSLKAVPVGIAPDTGAPYWASFPLSPAGVWA